MKEEKTRTAMERIRNMAKAGNNSGNGGEDEGTKGKKGKKDE